MTGIAIPALVMRGGTSRGVFLARADLPADRERLSALLVAITGSGHPYNIDGLGGGSQVTTKVAMLAPAADGRADVDFLFAQVTVESREVDYAPTCGNMLVAVGPAAIEMGLVAARDGETPVHIHAVNTGARVKALVQTPGGRVSYEGEARIDGVPGSAAPVLLTFRDIAGAGTGRLLPTGRPRETVGGVEVTCLDCAMPVVLARADAFGLTGQESPAALDAARDLLARLEPIRIEAGRRMGLGDVTRSVVPKLALLAAPRAGGTIAARYFMPWQAHPSLAISGAICIAACLAQRGSIAAGLAAPVADDAPVVVEHPMGSLAVRLDAAAGPGGLSVAGASVVRTARLIMRGEVLLPAAP